jgi:hypothetical protein
MLTGLVEKGQDKCAPYWPQSLHESVTFGDWTVTHTTSTEHGDFRETHLALSAHGQTRVLTHWWYDTWPDHGVPEKDGEMWVYANVWYQLLIIFLCLSDQGMQRDCWHCSISWGKHQEGRWRRWLCTAVQALDGLACSLRWHTVSTSCRHVCAAPVWGFFSSDLT